MILIKSLLILFLILIIIHLFKYMVPTQKEGFSEDLPNMATNDETTTNETEKEVKNILKAIGNKQNNKKDVTTSETASIETMNNLNSEINFDNLNISELQDSMNTFLKLKKKAQQINEEINS